MADVIYAGYLQVKGWHHKACEVISPDGISTCIHCQQNNLLQKIIVIKDETTETENSEQC